MRWLLCFVTVGVAALAATAFGQDRPMPESVRKQLAQAEQGKEKPKAEVVKATYLVKGLH